MKTLLLQHAIILGDTLKKSDPMEWLSMDGSCGCALGGALLAAGVTAEEFWEQFLPLPANTYDPIPEMECVKSRWPWLTAEHIQEISELYFQVYDGKKTIEDIAAYAQSVEPIPQVAALRPTEEKELLTA
jgi:hypothetical protein